MTGRTSSRLENMLRQAKVTPETFGYPFSRIIPYITSPFIRKYKKTSNKPVFGTSLDVNVTGSHPQ